MGCGVSRRRAAERPSRSPPHAIYWNVGPFADPEDPDSWPVAQHGVGITLQARGVGVILHTPVPDIDDPAHGLTELVQMPAIASQLCEVLQG